MNIDELAVLLCKLEADVQGVHGILPGELEMGNRTGSVRTHFQSLLQQLGALGIAENAVLGEGNNLNVHEVPDFLPQFQNGFQGGQLRVIDIHMGSDILDAIGGLHPNSLADPVPDILFRKPGLILLPALDALKQGTAHVPPGDTCRHAGVQMDMGLHKGRQGHLSGAVHHFLPGLGFQLRGDGCKLSVGYPNIHSFHGVFNRQILKQHNLYPPEINHSFYGPVPPGNSRRRRRPWH